MPGGKISYIFFTDGWIKNSQYSCNQLQRVARRIVGTNQVGKLVHFCNDNPRIQVVSIGGLRQLCGIQSLRVTVCPFVSCIQLLLALKTMNNIAELDMVYLPIYAAIIPSMPSLPRLTGLEISWCSKQGEIQIVDLSIPNVQTLGIFNCSSSLQQIHGLHHLQGLVELNARLSSWRTG